MQLTIQTAIFVLLAVIVLSACAERYTAYEGSLDTHFNVSRLSNNRKQTKDPFNVCSPESYGDCAKTAMPHLSRY